jgi:hypothetical protein
MVLEPAGPDVQSVGRRGGSSKKAAAVEKG